MIIGHLTTMILLTTSDLNDFKLNLNTNLEIEKNIDILFKILCTLSIIRFFIKDHFQRNIYHKIGNM
jgi:hypothetical protein